MHNDVYTPREVALAADVSEAEVLAALGRRVSSGGRLSSHGGRVSSIITETRLPYDVSHEYISHAEAVRVGRTLVARRQASAATVAPGSLFASVVTSRRIRSATMPLAVSSTLHVALLAVVLFVASFDLVPSAATVVDERPSDLMRLVFVATPGPGGGGGGGGLLQKPAPPKAMREGRHTINSPLPARREPKPIVPAPTPTPPEPKPEPPLKAEQLPVVVAPIVAAPADTRTRIGVLEETTAQNDSHGPGKGGGAGSGTGTGLGSGDGSGIGPGSGGGTGGGPYRPGSGIEPPRLLKETRADYTEEARQRGLSGEVLLEIVVRRDGHVGDVRILQGLGSGLNERAVQAVRQWRFAPAQRRGVPVDVIVEVAVEFRLR